MSEATMKPHLNLVVIGHHKSGKSTVMGRLLYELGTFNIDEYYSMNSSMTKYEKKQNEKQMDNVFADYLTKTKIEKQSGRTVHVTPVFQFTTDTFHYSCRDAPGLHKYTKNMLRSAACCDVALLIISAQNYPKHFEESIQKSNFQRHRVTGGTRHHSAICYALGITRIIVCINKMDTFKNEFQQKTAFHEIKSKTNRILNNIGYNTDKIAYIAINGLLGDNVLYHTVDSMKWYKGFVIKRKKQDITGYTLMDALEKAVSIPKRRSIYKPFRMQIDKTYTHHDEHDSERIIATGVIQQGTITPNREIQLYPLSDPNYKAKRKAMTGSIEIHNHRIDVGKPGDCVGIQLLYTKGSMPNIPRCGDVMIIRKHENSVSAIKARVPRFAAMIKVIHPSLILKSAKFLPLRRMFFRRKWFYGHRQGYFPAIYVQNGKVMCRIIEIRWRKQRSTKYKIYENNPSHIEYGDIAEVVFKVVNPCCIALSTFKEYGPLGRIIGMDHNEMIFYGKVVDVIDNEYYNLLLLEGYTRTYVRGMKCSINNGIKHLIVRNLNYNFFYKNGNTKFEYEGIEDEMKKKYTPIMPSD